MTRTSPIAFCRRSATTSTSAPYHGSSSAANVTRDCRARERGHRLRFDSAPLDTGPGATDPCGGRSRHPTRRRRIEAETAPPPPRTAVSGHAPRLRVRGRGQEVVGRDEGAGQRDELEASADAKDGLRRVATRLGLRGAEDLDPPV